MEKNIYSVGQVNRYLKNMLDRDAMMKRIYVRGEVSNCKYHRRGHIYFSLKDESGVIDCVMFRAEAETLDFQMQNGQRIIVFGRVSVYETAGKYQIYVNEAVPDGEGAQHLRFEQLKRELEEMGMFDARYKKPIPFYSRTVGIVTAPTAAAVQDMFQNALRRNPFVQLVLYPALVQGEGAADSIVEGIRALDAYGVDVIIVGRGGGPYEDLWAFNEEVVARAIFECRTPVISGVGHETDFTIADFVADKRVSTPTAAVELAVVEYRKLAEMMELYRNQLADRVEQKIGRYRQLLENKELRLRHVSPQYQLNEKRKRAAGLAEKLEQKMTGKMNDRRHRLQLLAGRLEGSSPLRKLQQGYSYTETEDGRALYSIVQVLPGEQLTVHVTDGRILARAEACEKLERME